MTNDPIAIRRLQASDAHDYRTLRLAALSTAPEAFSSTYAVEVRRSLAEHAERLVTSAVYGAYAADEIVGLIGFRRCDGEKEAHKGFVWGFYVSPRWRRRGVGAALIAALLKEARESVEQATLSVSEENRDAISLYERFGFSTYGVEPRALKSAASYSNAALMALVF